MANQNLSQFTEKLFVADADHTFIWDTAASISKRVSRNSWLNSGTLTSDAPVTISQTWNNAAVAFTGLKVNATSTASASGSLLLDLQVGGVSQFKVSKTGSITANSTFNLSGSIVQSSGNIIPSNALIFDYFNQDVVLQRDAANTLALRNSTNAQTFNVYGTYTSGTSYERLTLSAPSAANAIIGTNKGSGGGTARGLDLQTDGVTRMSISGSGPFLATLGFNSTSQWLELSANSGTTLQYNSTHKIYFSAAVCEITANNTTITTGLFRFSGATSSFPALKRSSTTLQARLADDTAFAPIQGKLTTDTAYTATVVAATGYITIYDSIGTAYRVPCAV